MNLLDTSDKSLDVCLLHTENAEEYSVKMPKEKLKWNWNVLLYGKALTGLVRSGNEVLIQTFWACDLQHFSQQNLAFFTCKKQR